MNKNLPNYITFFRILIVPMLIASFYLPEIWYHWVAASLFLIASITDFLDGYLARTLEAQSSLGRFLDPIADKLLVVGALMMLVWLGDLDGLHVLPAMAIICREVFISGLREHLAQANISMPVSWMAKVKTAVQMTAIGLLLWADQGISFDVVENTIGMHFTWWVGYVLLWISAILTIITGYDYLKVGLKHMSSEGR
tara:strand:+ start:321 stop:911 length:591 start_codon:yes stop_codon:yes gene_type:complete